MRGLQSDHARSQTVVVGNGSPAHQRRDDGNVEKFGKFDEQLGRVGVDDAAAGHDQRSLGRDQHVDCLLGLCT